MILFNGIISGIVATIFFDLFQIAVLFAYGGKKSNWALVGRYFIGVARMQFVQNDLINSNEEKNELIIGYFAHYLIGAIFGVAYTVINFILDLQTPSENQFSLSDINSDSVLNVLDVVLLVNLILDD